MRQTAEFVPDLVNGSPAARGAGGLPALATALVIGVLGAALIPFVDHWHETVIFRNREDHNLTTHALAPVVFTLVFLLLFLNPLLGAISPRLRLWRREWVLILSMWLVTASISYTNLTTSVVVAAGLFMGPAISRPLMALTGYKALLRPQMFLDKEASTRFYYGLGDGFRHVPLSEVPWQDWAGPLLFWVPFLLAVLVLSSALVQIVHRQWSRHELLAYPIADVADLLIAQDEGRRFPRIAYNKGFWIGFAITAFVFTLKGLSAWFPQVPDIQLGYWYAHLIKDFPFLARYCCNYTFSLFRWLVHPYMVALAVLLPRDVSLTCWLGWVLMMFGSGVFFLATGEVITEGPTNSLLSGMYVGIAAFVAFVGWREYARVLRCALGFRRDDDPAIRRAAWACRAFLLACAALVLLLTKAGLDWPLSLALVAAFCLILLVMARITAEIGLPWLLNFWGMARYMAVKMLGPAAFGPQGLAAAAIVGGMLDLYPANTLAANETTYRKLEERQARGLSRAGFNAALLLAGCVALAAALFSHLWNDYSFGASRENVTRVHLLKLCVDTSAPDIRRLQVEGRPPVLQAGGGLRRLALVKSAPGFWRFFVYGAILVGACGLMRLRFAWWPFHPLPLLFFNTWVMSRLWVSFLLGWLIKTALTTFGGGGVFLRSKPFFVGIIMGQLVTNCVWVAVNIIYFSATGRVPPVVYTLL